MKRLVRRSSGRRTTPECRSPFFMPAFRKKCGMLLKVARLRGSPFATRPRRVMSPDPSARPAPGLRSLVVGRAGDCRQRHEHDLEIEPKRPVLDVVVVAFGPIRKRGPTAEPVDLCQAGDSRLHTVPLVIAVDLLLVDLDVFGPLGTWA